MSLAGLVSWLKGIERILFGFLLGICATIVAIIVIHEVRGYAHLNLWERYLQERHLERTGELMDKQIQLAQQAMEDGPPLATSEFLARHLMGRLYEHHMAYAMTLLEQGDIESFNALRKATPYVTFYLRGQDLSGLDLSRADLGNADLSNSDLSGCKLTNASFILANLTAADLSDAEIDGTAFDNAVLIAARLVGVRGRHPSFRDAVLADASLTKADIEGADFAFARLDQANLWLSRFPDANFDSASMDMMTAVETDFGEVASMADVDLTGANLTSAKFNPEVTPRAWLVRAEGLTPGLARQLRQNGAVVEASDVLELVDKRIIDGFRAQIAEDDEIAPKQRRVVLLGMLQDYYQQ